MNSYIVAPNCQVKGIDYIFLKYFGYKTDGFFIDVGAYDGITASNTYGLAEAGWGGICYEPAPEFFNKCVEIHKNHPKVKCINVAVGDRKRKVFLTLAGTLSTFDDYQINTKYWGPEYRWTRQIPVDVISLDETLEENNVAPGFDVLNLDTEGTETLILKHFTLGHWRPKMAIVEAQELHPAEELRRQAPFINQYFADIGYEKVYCDEVNNIYVLG